MGHLRSCWVPAANWHAQRFALALWGLPACVRSEQPYSNTKWCGSFTGRPVRRAHAIGCGRSFERIVPGPCACADRVSRSVFQSAFARRPRLPSSTSTSLFPISIGAASLHALAGIVCIGFITACLPWHDRLKGGGGVSCGCDCDGSVLRALPAACRRQAAAAGLHRGVAGAGGAASRDADSSSVTARWLKAGADVQGASKEGRRWAAVGAPCTSRPLGGQISCTPVLAQQAAGALMFP
eukprot:366431-Chlamydomonas_euryale.AAC.21